MLFDGRQIGKSAPQQKAATRPLRPGYTTGSCAAAAARACLEHLLLHRQFAPTSLLLPSGQRLELQPINPCTGRSWAACGIIKDAGDDPDVTHGIEIRAKVSVLDKASVVDKAAVLDLDSQSGNDRADEIIIVGGEGVGRITKPGLELPPGEPAINPTPRRMIRDNAREILREAHFRSRLMIEISAPQGNLIATKTINARLGIIGGISILGTTGVVEPISALAWQDTVVACLKVAKACGCEGVVLTPGRSSEEAAQRLFPHWPQEAFIIMGDYVGFSLQQAKKFGFQQIIVAAQFAKLLKIAQGWGNTHADHSQIDRAWLAKVAHQAGYGQKTVAFMTQQAQTARTIYQYLREQSDSLFFPLLVKRISRDLGVRCILFSYEGEKIADSHA